MSFQIVVEGPNEWSFKDGSYKLPGEKRYSDWHIPEPTDKSKIRLMCVVRSETKYASFAMVRTTWMYRYEEMEVADHWESKGYRYTAFYLDVDPPPDDGRKQYYYSRWIVHDKKWGRWKPTLHGDEKRLVPMNLPKIALTFDDGLLTQYEVAYKKMKAKGYVGTAFIITSLVGKSWEERPCMDWKMIEELHMDGWAIGSHTVTHPNLAEIDFETFKHEVKQSKVDIKKNLGISTEVFAYPGGVVPEDPKRLRWIGLHYRVARTIREGTMNDIYTQNLKLHAFNISSAGDRTYYIGVLRRIEKEYEALGNKYAVLVIHGCKGEKSFDMDEEAIDNLLEILWESRAEVVVLE